MRLLPRSATGQPISNYFSVLTGPRRPGEEDGPEHMYYVLVDAGRTGRREVLVTQLAQILQYR